MNAPVLLRRSQINATSWNELIDGSPCSVIYAYTWYLDCVSPDWRALVWPSAQDLKIVMPLPVKTKWGLPSVQQPLFCQYLGIFSRQALTHSELRTFLDSFHRHFAYISQYAFHPRLTPLLRQVLPSIPDLEVEAQTTHWLDLSTSYESVRKRYKKDRRENLKRGEQYAWKIRESNDVVPLLELFRKNHAPGIRSVKESAYTTLKHILTTLLDKKKARIQYAQQAGILHAGICILENDEMGIYIFNAADATGRKGNARTVLLDHYFEKQAGPLRMFDFESPEVPSIARFYESFGAKKQEFLVIKKNKLPFPFRQLQEWRKGWFKTIESRSSNL